MCQTFMAEKVVHCDFISKLFAHLIMKNDSLETQTEDNNIFNKIAESHLVHFTPSLYI